MLLYRAMTCSVPNANLARAPVPSCLVGKCWGADVSESLSYTKSFSKEKAEKEANHNGKTSWAFTKRRICTFAAWSRCYPLCYYAGWSSKPSLLLSLSCLAFGRQHHHLTLDHQELCRSSRVVFAVLFVLCIPQQPHPSIRWGQGGFSGRWQYQQVWLCGEWRSFSILILSAPQQVSQSIYEELLQMSPCKVTTGFGRKLEGEKQLKNQVERRLLILCPCL